MKNRSPNDFIQLDQLMAHYLGQATQIQKRYNDSFEKNLAQVKLKAIPKNEVLAALPSLMQIKQFDFVVDCQLSSSTVKGNTTQLQFAAKPVVAFSSFLRENNSINTKLHLQVKQITIHKSKH